MDRIMCIFLQKNVGRRTVRTTFQIVSSDSKCLQILMLSS